MQTNNTGIVLSQQFRVNRDISYCQSVNYQETLKQAEHHIDLHGQHNVE